MIPTDIADFEYKTKEELIELFINQVVVFNKIDNDNLLLYVKKIRNGNVQLAMYVHILNKGNIKKKIKINETTLNEFNDIYFEFNQTVYKTDSDITDNKLKKKKKKQIQTSHSDIDRMTIKFDC